MIKPGDDRFESKLCVHGVPTRMFALREDGSYASPAVRSSFIFYQHYPRLWDAAEQALQIKLAVERG